MRATIAEGDNHNHDDGKDACALNDNNVCTLATAMTHPVVRRWHIKRWRQRVTRQRRLEDERRRQRDKWLVASWDNQMAKQRLRQSCKAELVVAQQQG